jgi:hypothetical protein
MKTATAPKLVTSDNKYSKLIRQLNENITSVLSNETKQMLVLLAKHKCAGRIVPAKRAADLRKNIEDLNQKGTVDNEFYQQRLSHFDFHIPETPKFFLEI